MNGAQAMIRTLVDAGVDVCFMNPGTSEMHFVAALDDVPEMRGVLALFEGVATGAADGYARIAGKPAATLLHLGPGMANGMANLHNARRARVPMVNIVGDHATYHLEYDAPLTSDIEGVAAPEAANNAAAQTAFIPTLTLGIPGSNSTAMLLAALTLLARETMNALPLAASKAPWKSWLSSLRPLEECWPMDTASCGGACS